MRLIKPGPHVKRSIKENPVYNAYLSILDLKRQPPEKPHLNDSILDHIWHLLETSELTGIYDAIATRRGVRNYLRIQDHSLKNTIEEIMRTREAQQ